MRDLSKSFSLLIILILAVSSLIMVKPAYAQNISLIINSNTTWTKANSPYNLTGSVAINQGATLTIEAGTVVNLGNYYIQVDGTLNARGSSTDKITFNNGQITFSKDSTSWNKQAGFGCIIENSILNATVIEINSAAKINNNTFVNSTTSEAVIHIPVGSPIISNNTILAPQAYRLIWCGGSATISGNTIVGGEFGIELEGAFAYGLNSGTVAVSNNTVHEIDIDNGCSGTIIVENNLVSGLYIGIGDQATVQNNTIIDGIFVQTNESTIIYNNILHNGTLTSIYDNDGSVNATYNWWGTTDTNAIEQSIHENNVNVTFIPFLTSPNLQAPAIPSPVLTPVPTPTPTPNSFFYGLNSTALTAIISVIVIIAAVTAGLIVYFKKRKR